MVSKAKKKKAQNTEQPKESKAARRKRVLLAVGDVMAILDGLPSQDRTMVFNLIDEMRY